MANQTWQVGASTDDCLVRDGVGGHPHTWDSIDLTIAYFRCGNYGDDEYYGGGARFTNITIPKSSTISSAYFKLHTDGTYGSRSGSQSSIIEGEAIDDAATFSDLANYHGRSRTSAAVDWDWNSPGVGQWVTSSDIKTVIQEIVNRGGWSSGNDLVIFCETDANSTSYDDVCESYDDSSAVAPKLEVTWVTAGLSIPVAMHHYNRINKIIRG